MRGRRPGGVGEGIDGDQWKLMPTPRAMAMMAATDQSTVTQNGGRHDESPSDGVGVEPCVGVTARLRGRGRRGLVSIEVGIGGGDVACRTSAAGGR
jgi:hypothetical protein